MSADYFILVLLSFTYQGVETTPYGTYEDFDKCFSASLEVETGENEMMYCYPVVTI